MNSVPQRLHASARAGLASWACGGRQNSCRASRTISDIGGFSPRVIGTKSTKTADMENKCFQMFATSSLSISLMSQRKNYLHRAKIVGCVRHYTRDAAVSYTGALVSSSMGRHLRFRSCAVWAMLVGFLAAQQPSSHTPKFVYRPADPLNAQAFEHFYD